MPWNQNNGGNGGPWGGGEGGEGGGGRGQGPWGQGPRGGGGPGGKPPNIDELIKQGQDKLKGMMSKGGGSPKATNKFVILIIIGVLAALWVRQAVYTVNADEIAIELLFGKAKLGDNGPGIHFHLWPFETVEVLQVTKENQENIGTSSSGTSGGASGLMLAGDQNIVDIQFTVLWRIKDARAYLFNIRDPRRVMQMVAESAMRDYVGQTPGEEIRTTGRVAAQEAVRIQVQNTLDEYGAGIQLTGVKLESANPPVQVKDSFAEVQRAEQDSIRFVREAGNYSNQILGKARAEAATILEKSKAYKGRVIAEAQGESQRFVSVYTEYAKAKDVTRKRLFLETMEKVLRGSNKVIIEGTGGSGVVPYLPLPEIDKRRSNTTTGAVQ